MIDLQLAQKASNSLALSPSKKSSTSLPTASAPDRKACTALALLLSVIRGRSMARKSSILAVMYARCRLPLPSSGDCEGFRSCRGELFGVGEVLSRSVCGRACCHSVRRIRSGFATSIVPSRSLCSLRAARMEKRFDKMSVAMSVNVQRCRKCAEPGRSGSSKSYSCSGAISQSSGLM